MKEASNEQTYDYSVAKGFAISAMVWGTAGMLIGVFIAFQLVFPVLNFNTAWLSFGRLRPLHTNAVLYGFTLSGMFSCWYYMSQRVLKVRLVLPRLAKFHLILYNLIIVLAVITLPLGFSSSKEYAELQWPIDILVVVMWLSWGMHVFAMCGARREKTMYITIWYFLATFFGVGMLYLFNNLAVPTYFVAGVGQWMHAVSMYAGTNDANVQWWFGHNAVAFVLTVPIVGINYYIIPKQANQPVYSYKLTLWTFWGLIFVYLWAGPHHMMYSTLPDWVQTLGMVFSMALIIPSWGSMINLILTVNGKWEQVKTDPFLRFSIFALVFYGLATFEGSMQASKSVNAIAHFTDWVIGHVHGGALGWVVFSITAALYYIIPRMWNTALYSVKLALYQFWFQTAGIVLYVVSMWIGGITQSLMWRATDEYGNLVYSFLETVHTMVPFWAVRGIGGTLFLTGMLLMSYNIFKTIAGAPQPITRRA